MKTAVAIIVLLPAGLAGCGGGGSNGPACGVNRPCFCAVGMPGPNANCPQVTLCTNIVMPTESRQLCTIQADRPISQNCEGGRKHDAEELTTDTDTSTVNKRQYDHYFDRRSIDLSAASDGTLGAGKPGATSCRRVLQALLDVAPAPKNTASDPAAKRIRTRHCRAVSSPHNGALF
jgi:hypothetical protein